MTRRSRSSDSGVAQGVTDALFAVMGSPVRLIRWLLEWTRWWNGSPSRRVMFVVIFAIATLAWISTRTSRLELRYAHAAMDRAEVAETIYLPPPLALRVLSLGHQSMLADALFARANIYFAAHLFGDRVFPLLGPYTEAILALEPDNIRVYEWASQAVKYAQMIDHSVLEESNEYARRGIARFPDHWRFYFDIGFNYTVEWKAGDAAEQEAMRRKALPYFSVAAALPGSQLDPNFVTALYLEENEVDMALFYAYLRYWEASDREKEALRARITRYESESAARALTDQEAAWKSSYGYLPFGLFEFVGAPNTIAVDASWAALAESGSQGSGVQEER
ncbi:MAG: hypothetical protein VX938_03070 [Myxococcota bacterium]|nr:hypothetical protein [Myxococcota bacterium]